MYFSQGKFCFKNVWFRPNVLTNVWYLIFLQTCLIEIALNLCSCSGLPYRDSSHSDEVNNDYISAQRYFIVSEDVWDKSHGQFYCAFFVYFGALQPNFHLYLYNINISF